MSNSENTSLINISTLENEYKILLNQYEQSYQLYINVLNKYQQNAVSNYDLLKTSNGSSNTYCRGEGWNQSGWPKMVGYYPKEQCQALCDENPYCGGYDIARKDNNGNYDCALFNIANLSPVYSPEGYGCYKKKNFNAPYKQTIQKFSYGIVGIGTDGKDYYRPNLNVSWNKLNNDTGGDLIACAFNPANNMYFGITKSAGAVYKNSFNDYTFTALVNSCCIIDLAVSYDGQYGVVVDTANKLWAGTMTTFMNQTGFTPAVNPNQWEYCKAVAISPQGQVFVVGGDNSLYMKPSYLTLKTTLWKYIPGSCCLKSLSFAPDGLMVGVGTDGQLYTKLPDNEYTGNWTLVPNSGNVISIAIINTSTTGINTIYPPQATISNNNKIAEFVSLQGRSYWGSGSLKQGQVQSIEDCKSMCASDMNCTGATFQSDRNYCYTRTGEGDIVIGNSNDYALIPAKRQALLTLQIINNKLLNVVQQLNLEFKKLEPKVEQNQQDKNKKQKILLDNYTKLLEEQKIIDDNLNEFQTLEKENENYSLIVNQKNILFKFWSLFAIILLAIIFKVVFKIEGYSFLFLIITVLVVMILLSLDWWSLLPIVFIPLLIKMIYFP
jgi:hypothetical protein